MSAFQRVAHVSDIPDPGRQVYEVDDRMVVVIHVGGQFYCLDDVCTHDGGPLGNGVLTDHALACPRHGAKFDVRDGRPLSMPATEATPVHEVMVQDNQVFVRVNENG